MDPTKPIPYTALPDASEEEVDLATLLDKQLRIANVLQTALLKDQNSLTTRELKDLASSASTLLSLSHRTDSALASLTTYRTFVSVVLEFLRERSDTLGEDLMTKLRQTAAEMRASTAVAQVLD